MISIVFSHVRQRGAPGRSKIFCDIIGNRKGRQGPASHQELFADFDGLHQLRGVAVHDVRCFFSGLCACIHGQGDLRKGWRIVAAVAHHRHHLCGCKRAIRGCRARKSSTAFSLNNGRGGEIISVVIMIVIAGFKTSSKTTTTDFEGPRICSGVAPFEATWSMDLSKLWRYTSILFYDLTMALALGSCSRSAD